MAAKKKAEEMVIEIPKIEIRELLVHVEGDSPLIMHKWSEKAKKEMLEKQMKKSKTTGKEPKNPVRDFIDSMYWLEGKPEEYSEEAFCEAIKNGARFGFPSVGFKAAAISAGYRMGVLKDKVSSRAAFHIDAEFVEIKGTPNPREDMVMIGSGTTRVADIRYRGEFPTWSADFVVKYNAGIITAEQVYNLFNLAGFACGVGEWRIEKGGTYGAFHVAT